MAPGDFSSPPIGRHWKPRQYLRQADALAGRARCSRGGFLARTSSFAEDFDSQTEGHDAARRRLVEFLRVRRSARRRDSDEPHAGHQLHLCPHAPDSSNWPHAGGRYRQEPRGARAQRQSNLRRPAAADHGRKPRPLMLPEGTRPRPIARPTAPHLRLRGRRRLQQRGRRAAAMEAERRVRRAVDGSAYSHTAAKQSVLFSISDRPDARRRSASGARDR